MNMNNPLVDIRSNNPKASGNLPRFRKNSDGSWNISGNTKGKQEIRWAISQNNGFNASKMRYYTPTVRQLGYMQVLS